MAYRYRNNQHAYLTACQMWETHAL